MSPAEPKASAMPDLGVEQLRSRNLKSSRTLGEHLMAMGAFFVLIGVDGVTRLLGFRRFHRMVGSFPRLGALQRDPQKITRLCDAVDRAAAYYLKRAWCLQRSATTTCLLRLRGVDAEMVIGVKKIPFYAHAWVEVDGQVVNDHPMVQQRYSVLERC